jgi:hypothetical protein
MRRNARTDKSIASDPNSSAQELLRVVKKYPVQVLENVSLPLLIMEDPSMVNIVRFAWTTIARDGFNKASSKMSAGDLIEFFKWGAKVAEENGSHGEVITACYQVHRGQPPGTIALFAMERLQLILCSGMTGDRRMKEARVAMDAADALFRIRGIPHTWPTTSMKPNRRRG